MRSLVLQVLRDDRLPLARLAALRLARREGRSAGPDTRELDDLVLDDLLVVALSVVLVLVVGRNL